MLYFACWVRLQVLKTTRGFSRHLVTTLKITLRKLANTARVPLRSSHVAFQFFKLRAQIWLHLAEQLLFSIRYASYRYRIELNLVSSSWIRFPLTVGISPGSILKNQFPWSTCAIHYCNLRYVKERGNF